MGVAPAFGGGAKGGFVFGPVMQRGRIEIGSGRPDNRVDLGVESDLGEDGRVAQRSVEFAGQDRRKINRAGQTISEGQSQGVWGDKLN